MQLAYAPADTDRFVLLLGRPGLDPGTLGSKKEGYGWLDPSGEVGNIRDSRKSCLVVSDPSGGVGMVRGKFRGISERLTWRGHGLIDH